MGIPDCSVLFRTGVKQIVIRRARVPGKTRPVISGPAGNFGFTLFEIMLTVGLIALTATFVGLNIGQTDSKLADLEAKRIIALLNLAQDESILTGRPLLLNFDTVTGSYKFTPLATSRVFLVDDSEDVVPESADEDENVKAEPIERDSFYKLRQLPEGVKIEFSRLPDVPDPNDDEGFVPKRVHEILNKSLFEEEDEGQEIAEENNVVLIEPDGLISPFTMRISIEEYVVNVEFNQFGKAVTVAAR